MHLSRGCPPHWKMKRPSLAEETGPGVRPEGLASGETDVLSLQALGAAGNIELDLLPFLEGAEALGLDRAVVAEEVLTPAVLRDEPESLRVVEPLHGTNRHLQFFFLVRPQWIEPEAAPQFRDGHDRVSRFQARG